MLTYSKLDQKTKDVFDKMLTELASLGITLSELEDHVKLFSIYAGYKVLNTLKPVTDPLNKKPLSEVL